jgi:hypothetical protein
MDQNRNPQTSREGWSAPLPEHLAHPSYWPAMLALGMTLALLGPVTSLAISVVGLGFAVAALIGWIGDLVT